MSMLIIIIMHHVKPVRLSSPASKAGVSKLSGGSMEGTPHVSSGEGVGVAGEGGEVQVLRYDEKTGSEAKIFSTTS